MKEAQQLSDMFQCPIEVWEYRVEWICIHSTHVTDRPSNELEIPSYLEKLVEPGKPFIQPLDLEKTVFFAPIHSEQSATRIAVGITGLDKRSIMRIGLDAAIHINHSEASSQEHLDLYSSQITADFEEMTWLRSLADHLSICTVENSFVKVAKDTLPDLREIISCESIVLMRERTSYASSQARFEIINYGKPVNEEHCREVVQTFGQHAEFEPFVSNSASKGRGHSQIPFQSVVLTSVSKDDQVFGWLLAVNKDFLSDSTSIMCEPLGGSRIEFGTAEASLMQAAARLLATHGKNFELFREKEKLLIGTLRTMINALDAKDPYTCGHSDRVAQFARQIARTLGLSQQECEEIYVAGLVHDIGKVGVPDHILQKPGRLTKEEFAEIKKHPQIGFDILKHLQPLSYVLPGVLHHHEAYDGSGYPFGLVGDEIPLMGRILAVADAYDAMTSDRPYRKGMPTDKAESIIQNGAGGQWDEHCVTAFFDCIDEIYEISRTADEHVAKILQPNRHATDEDEIYDSNDSIDSAILALKK